MLVAGAALSLIAPIGAQASDINIEEIDTYVRKKSPSKKRLDSNSFSNDIATSKQKIDSSAVDFSQFVFQAAVPKFVELSMKPPSGQNVTKNGGNLTQVLHVKNTQLGSKTLMVRG